MLIVLGEILGNKDGEWLCLLPGISFFFSEELSLDNSRVALAWELTELREGLPWPQGVGMNVREVWH